MFLGHLLTDHFKGAFGYYLFYRKLKIENNKKVTVYYEVTVHMPWCTVHVPWTVHQVPTKKKKKKNKQTFMKVLVDAIQTRSKRLLRKF